MEIKQPVKFKFIEEAVPEYSEQDEEQKSYIPIINTEETKFGLDKDQDESFVY